MNEQNRNEDTYKNVLLDEIRQINDTTRDIKNSIGCILAIMLIPGLATMTAIIILIIKLYESGIIRF